MNRRRVKITGLGFVTPAGVGKEAFKAGILESVSRVGVIKRFDPEAGPFVGAEVKGFRLGEFMSDPGSKRLPRHTQFALAGTILALKDAGLSVEQVRAMSPVQVIGTSLMDSDVINKTIEEVTRRGPRYGSTRVIFQGPVSAIAGAVVELVGAGRALSLQSACCAGSDAIGHAARMVELGETDLAICGGTEAPLFFHPMLELKMAGLSPDTDEQPEQLCRPFDLWRTTGVIGEGACILILEPESSPRPGYAFVSGYAFASDTSQESGSGLGEAIRLCLGNARVRSGEVDHISAWGPGHRVIDAGEARVLARVFGAALADIAAVSIKGAIGNPFGAAGAIQAGCVALGFRDHFIPPTVNWRHPDPDCPLNLSAAARFVSTHTALVNSHGLSGTNSSLLLRRCT
jgi:3-oxoacyl-[acyl-carrier-protein] synthase II